MFWPAGMEGSVPWGQGAVDPWCSQGEADGWSIMIIITVFTVLLLLSPTAGEEVSPNGSCRAEQQAGGKVALPGETDAALRRWPPRLLRQLLAAGLDVCGQACQPAQTMHARDDWDVLGTSVINA